MKKLLRKIKRLTDKVFGTKADEFYWQFRHIFAGDKWVKKYISLESINHPHRKFLIDIISSYAPFESILEVGCASGPNLYLLSKKFPEAKLYGVDISKKAIQTGQKYLQSQNIKNIFLSSTKADNLKQFPNKSIDIIFTDAALIYIGPDKIEKVVREMLRLAKKAIIINEWHRDFPKSFYNDHWVHNYRLLFNKFISEDNIKFTKINSELWGGDWGEYGNIIEIRI